MREEKVPKQSWALVSMIWTRLQNSQFLQYLYKIINVNGGNLKPCFNKLCHTVPRLN